MATAYRGCLGEVGVGETDTDLLKFPIEVATKEAQVLTVKLPDGEEFVAAGTGSTCVEVDDPIYVVQLLAAHVDVAGIVYIKSTGATSAAWGYVRVLPTPRMTVDSEGRVSVKSEAQKRLERSS